MTSRVEPDTAVDIAVLLWLCLVDEDLAAEVTPLDRDEPLAAVA